jgi:hypothetical protein
MSYPAWDMIRNSTFVRPRNFPLIGGGAGAAPGFG